jgi:hypothetical protein
LANATNPPGPDQAVYFGTEGLSPDWRRDNIFRGCVAVMDEQTDLEDEDDEDNNENTNGDAVAMQTDDL